MSPASGQKVMAESRLVSEYLADRWPGRRHLQRVRVGGIPAGLTVDDLDPAELVALGVWRRWVDALVVDPPSLHVIEAGLVASPGDLSQLQLYLRLVPQTPELSDLATLQLKGRLVYAIADPVLTAMAREQGIACETYCPPWVGPYLAERHHRHRRPPLPP